MIVYKCDMCGHESQHEKETVEIPVTEKMPFDNGHTRIMLCEKCGDMLVEFVANVRRSYDAPANDGQVGNGVETSGNAATGSEDAGSPASEGGAV